MGWLRQMVGLPPRVRRRGAGHRLHRDVHGAALRARADERALAERRGPPGRRRSARRLCLRPGAQLDREGGAARGVRQGPPPARRPPTTLMRSGSTSSSARSRTTSRRACARARSSPRPARPPPPRSTRSPASAALRASAPAVAARRRRARRDRDGAPGVPLDVGGRRACRLAWCSTRTSGWAIGFDFSAYFVRDPQHLVRVMSTNPSYLRTAHDARGEQLPRLGHPARPPLPRAQGLVPPRRRGRRGRCRRASAATRRTPSG